MRSAEEDKVRSVVVRAGVASLMSRLSVVANRPAVAVSVISGVAAVICFVYILRTPASPLLNGDTQDYLYFDPGRPIGYPIFVRAIWLLTGDYSAVRPVQILLFVLSACVASWAVFRHGWGFITAFVFLLGVVGYPGPIGMADSIMSDSVAASLYLFYLAAVLGFVRVPSLGRFCLVCLVMALSITVRPVGVALVASSLALLCLHRRELRGGALRASGLLAVFAVVGWYATPAAHSLMSGASAGTPVARGLIQKVMFIEPIPDRTPSCDDDFIESLTLPVLRYMRGVPEQHRDLLRLRYSSYLRFASIIPGLVERHHLARESDADPILMCYSLARIRERPLPFVAATARDYWNLVVNHTFISAEQRADYNSFLAAHPPVLPPAFRNTDSHYQQRERAVQDTMPLDAAAASEFLRDEISFEPPPARPAALVLMVNLIQVAATVIGFVCMVLVCLHLAGIRIPGDWITLGVIAIAAQFSLAITAVVEMALPRYVFPVWPFYWITILVLVLRISRTALRRRRPHWAWDRVAAS